MNTESKRVQNDNGFLEVRKVACFSGMHWIIFLASHFGVRESAETVLQIDECQAMSRSLIYQRNSGSEMVWKRFDDVKLQIIPKRSVVSLLPRSVHTILPKDHHILLPPIDSHNWRVQPSCQSSRVHINGRIPSEDPMST